VSYHRTTPARGSVTPKKHLGQHFLTDRSIAQRIAALALPAADETLIEIGPGTGVLTRELLDLGHRVLAIEYDGEAVVHLGEQFTDTRLEVLHGDFLKVPLPEGPLCLVGNLPYNVSSPILFRALAQREQIRRMTFMVQKEVAQRWAAAEGSRIYGIPSVLVGYFYEAKLAFSVPPGVFFPVPKVTSAVITFERRDPLPEVPYARFLTVVKTAFGQRRKTLHNATKGLGITLTPEQAGLRAEQLSPQAFAELARQIPTDNA
jgi:16S rRNA (adenine1518-N6/adenine1519-N6)-dimethyltransferase